MNDVHSLTNTSTQTYFYISTEICKNIWIISEEIIRKWGHRRGAPKHVYVYTQT